MVLPSLVTSSKGDEGAGGVQEIGLESQQLFALFPLVNSHSVNVDEVGIDKVRS